jgi:hypothetical protein
VKMKKSPVPTSLPTLSALNFISCPLAIG